MFWLDSSRLSTPQGVHLMLVTDGPQEIVITSGRDLPAGLP